MKAVNATVGALGVDSLPYSMGGTTTQAQALKIEGVKFFAGYLGAMNAARLKQLLDAGIAFVPVTFAGEYNDGPDDEIAQIKALGIPAGTTVFVDLEGLSAAKADPVALAAKINAWADGIRAAGYMPGLYVGVPQPFTEEELWHLHVERYWRGQGSVRDRFNKLSEPTGCGWCMTQVWPSEVVGGVLVDFDQIGMDYKRRVPAWVVR